MEQISRNLFLFRDTCHVYIIRAGDMAVLVDFGDGAVLKELPAWGIQRVTDILITHHHRDQVQGLPPALRRGEPLLSGTCIWAPHTEQDLFASVDQHWQIRSLLNNYDVRQDRYSLLEPLPLTGTLQDYQSIACGGRDWTVLPAPGHTPGSVALQAVVDDRSLIFTGDLLCGPGKVWSMAALQWSYQGMEGAAVMIPVLLDLCQREAELLLPSHGEVMDDPQAAIRPLVRRLRQLLDARQENLRMEEWLREPYEQITPHLLRNRTSVANSYVLISGSGKALIIDYGYDFVTSNNNGSDPALHRPWLYTLAALKQQFGVRQIDVVVPTHYHDDHVAGFNLLRQKEGTRVWAAQNFANILEHPNDYDLPCLWYDPIPVDRVLPLYLPVQWEEYTFELYPLVGHTRYAAAIAFTVDGTRVLATGDQHKGSAGLDWNYVYQNRFSFEDYRSSADLYKSLFPDLILPGHWQPLWTDSEYFAILRQRGEQLEHLHSELLPLESINLGAEGFAARIKPYFIRTSGGCPIEYLVEVRNPLSETTLLRAQMVLPEGWSVDEPEKQIRLGQGQGCELSFIVMPPLGLIGTRFRLAVDITVDTVRLGQQAEALVDLTETTQN